MSQQTETRADGRERFTICATDNIEMEYSGGDLHHIRVTATWKRGHRPTDDALNGEWVDKQVTAHVEYTVRGEGVVLTGFYPETTRTGHGLYRETLKALRVLPHAASEVAQRIDDEMVVEDPKDVLGEKLSEGDDGIAV